MSSVLEKFTKFIKWRYRWREGSDKYWQYEPYTYYVHDEKESLEDWALGKTIEAQAIYGENMRGVDYELVDELPQEEVKKQINSWSAKKDAANSMILFYSKYLT